MKLEFSKDKKGYIEAEHLLRITRQLKVSDETERVRGELERIAFEHLGHDVAELDRVHAVLDQQSTTLLARLSNAWHRFWGPSSVEVDLSKQRIDALERADRAERSAFESLAEMSRVGRERDQALAELKDLRHQLDKIQNDQKK